MLSLISRVITCAIFIPLSHSLPSIGASIFIGLLINKTNNRLLYAFFFISSILRFLLLLFLPANNRFPSSINHMGEIFALFPIISIVLLLTLFLLFLSFLSTYFSFIFLNRKLPYHSSCYLYYCICYYIFFFLILYIYLLYIFILLGPIKLGFNSYC